MTDHETEPALPPELATALHRWAAATDPTADLVGGPAIRAGATGRARWTSRRALLVAAVVLVALLAASAVWAVGHDDAGRVTTDPAPTGPDDGVPLDVVIDTTRIEGDTGSSSRSVEIGPVCPPAARCSDLPEPAPAHLLDGTTLVLSETVPDGSEWEVVVSTWRCSGARCARDADGSPPGDEDAPPHTCVATFSVDGPTLATVGLSGATDRPECGAATDGPTPTLTAPPRVTLREPYPQDCGTGIGDVLGADGVTDADSWDCLAGSLSGGDPAELVVYTARARGAFERSWWRSDGERLVVFREPVGEVGPPGPAGDELRWIEQVCTELVADPTGDPGALTAGGCAPETELDLAYEGPAGRDDPPSTTPSVPLDLVVTLAGATDAGPTITDRWVLADGDTPILTGPLAAGATALGADDLSRTGELAIWWERFDCVQTCAPATAAGDPAAGISDVSVRCEADIPAAVARVVVTFRSDGGATGGGVCEVTPVDELPALTVPPAWSLRERYPSECVDDVDDASLLNESGCLLGVLDEGRTAESVVLEPVAGGDPRPTVWRVAPGEVTVTVPPLGEGEPWLRTTCTGLAAVGPGEVDPVGCGAQEVMSLDPP